MFVHDTLLLIPAIRKGHKLVFFLFFGWALVKPGIKIMKKQSAPLEGTNMQDSLFLDSTLNLPDLTESNNCLQVMQYVFYKVLSVL